MSVSATPFKGIVPAAGTAIARATAPQTSANAWIEVIASTATPIYILAMVATIYQNSTFYLGTGTAGAEVVVATEFGISLNKTRSLPSIFSVPLRVPAGTRVAMKAPYAESLSVLGVIYVSDAKVV